MVDRLKRPSLDDSPMARRMRESMDRLAAEGDYAAQSMQREVAEGRTKWGTMGADERFAGMPMDTPPPVQKPNPARDPNVNKDTARSLAQMRRQRLDAAKAAVEQQFGPADGQGAQDRRASPRPVPGAAKPAPLTLARTTGSESGQAGDRPSFKDEAPAARAADERVLNMVDGAGEYLGARKALPEGVRRFDLGLETPSDVYVSVDKNGNRVYTDDPAFAASRSSGKPLTAQSLMRGRTGAGAEFAQSRIDQNLADAEGGFEYGGFAGDVNAAEIKANYEALVEGAPRWQDDQAARNTVGQAAGEAARTGQIEAARAGTRPVDLRRRTEAAQRASASIPLEDQLAMRKDDRAERQLAATINRDTAAQAMQQMNAAQRAEFQQLAQTNTSFNQGAQLLKLLNETDSDGMPVYQPREVLQLGLGLFEAAGAGDQGAAAFFNTAPGRVIAGLMDQELTKVAADTGNFAWDDGGVYGSDMARTGFGDVRLDDQGGLYAMERPEALGMQGRADFGSPRALSRRLRVPEGATLGRLYNELQYQDPEEE